MGERRRRPRAASLVAAVVAAMALAACTVEQTPDGIQICYYTSAGIACTLEPTSGPAPAVSSSQP
jgi:hypothetical protein